MFDWQGCVARYLTNNGFLDCVSVGDCGFFTCNKNTVCHLALIAAASRTVLSSLPVMHRKISETMVEHSSEHLTSVDVQSLLAIESHDLRLRQIENCLSDLVTWNLIQEIVVNTKSKFYDVDTRPHEHIFDPKSGRIHDA